MSKPKELTKQSLRYFLKKQPRTLLEICEYYNVSPLKVMDMLKDLKKEYYNIIEENYNSIELKTDIDMGVIKHAYEPEMWKGDKLVFGFSSDNHMCNFNSREDVNELLYDIFEQEGIRVVYNGGNMIDGEHRFNKNEIFVHGCTNQLKYCAEHYPYRKDIITKFVAGDDHEGWYVQREGINVGKYLVGHRKDLGRNDFQYMGYGEADILLSDPDQEHKAYLRLVHPGGGTAYALSYTMQKLVESYQGGEKPSIILAGHYHKLDYSYPREVHAIQMGTTCDQTLFMRKKKIQAMVGGGIVTLRRASDGTINRVSVEFITFYDKAFYIGKDKYWKGQ
jgi:hypothetical protein